MEVSLAESSQVSNRSTFKSFAVLELLGRVPQPLTLVDIARATDLNRTTAKRFVSTLCELGYVERLAVVMPRPLVSSRV
ncbi:helix-turn-helix domain-containing protein [Rhodococcus wratislaviensis]|uniref:helix-turn-helix domain-containing protein n=1 Tax=Rhodococcus wratislaviensis TaxID=44752 RepID=UPI0012DDC907